MLFRRLASTSSVLPPTIQQLLSPSNNLANSQSVRVQGWIKSVRRQKNVTFAVISDGSYAPGLQAVLNSSHAVRSLTNGTCVNLLGDLVKSRGPGQECELQVESIDILGDCDPEMYPIQNQAMPVDHLREHVHLRTRTEKMASMLRFRDFTMRSLHAFFENEGFCHVNTPILTSNDCEGAGETFRVSHIPDSAFFLQDLPQQNFFGKPAYLTVSSQLHLEAVASAIARVYTLSPCFRAERSQTNRHLAEFWMLEAEWAFTYKVDDVCHLVQSLLRSILRRDSPERLILSRECDERKLKFLECAAEADRTWTRMTYSEALKELEKHHSLSRTFKFQPHWGRMLQSEHERWLTEQLVGGPVFVTNYPASLKPFYMRLNDDGQTVACFDLLVPFVGELAGGSLREERLRILDSALEKNSLSDIDLQWYRDLRKYGSSPHGGFGMGLERLMSWLTGIDNVRECIAMPRTAGRMLL